VPSHVRIRTAALLPEGPRGTNRQEPDAPRRAAPRSCALRPPPGARRDGCPRMGCGRRRLDERPAGERLLRAHRSVKTAVIGHVEWVTFVHVDHVPTPGEIVHAVDVFELP